MGKLTFLEYGEVQSAPVTGLALADLAEGSVVKLNENGSPVEFYVACHNYESALNGAGRTLLVRKDCYDKRQWHSSNVNAYATSDIDAWLNGDYKALLDQSVQAAIDTTTFYYTPGNGNTMVTTLARSVFMLSMTEYGLSFYDANAEGSGLPIASTLLIGYLNGSATTQHTRTPVLSDTGGTVNVSTTGTRISNYTIGRFGVRPCFTLPSTALFDTTTLEFKEA